MAYIIASLRSQSAPTAKYNGFSAALMLRPGMLEACGARMQKTKPLPVDQKARFDNNIPVEMSRPKGVNTTRIVRLRYCKGPARAKTLACVKLKRIARVIGSKEK